MKTRSDNRTRRNKKRSRRSQRHRRTAHRRKLYRTTQRGGAFGFTIPDEAIVPWRSLDDDGTQPAIFMTKADADKAEEEMDHLVS